MCKLQKQESLRLLMLPDTLGLTGMLLCFIDKA